MEVRERIHRASKSFFSYFIFHSTSFAFQLMKIPILVLLCGHVSKLLFFQLWHSVKFIILNDSLKFVELYKKEGLIEFFHRLSFFFLSLSLSLSLSQNITCQSVFFSHLIPFIQECFSVLLICFCFLLLLLNKKKSIQLISFK